MIDSRHLIWLVPAAMLCAALLPLPYGYYQLLRLVVTGSCGLLAYWEFRKNGLVIWLMALILVAILFNPIVPVRLDRDQWAVIDIAVALLLLAHWSLRRRHLIEPPVSSIKSLR
jgi:hypothetical protein